jgi:hypothetical protein
MKEILECSKCHKILNQEKELELSQDFPKYLGGIDNDERHYLCHSCHGKYENLILNAMMDLFNLPKEYMFVNRIELMKTLKIVVFQNPNKYEKIKLICNKIKEEFYGKDIC